MSHSRHVALIIDAARPYDRKIISGVARYVKEHGSEWSMYVEEDPLGKLPDLHHWQGDGILANFDDRRVAEAVRGLKVPVVGIGGGYGWYNPALHIPYFTTDNVAIARLAVDHFVERGFRHLAFYGCPRTRINRWSEERAEAFRHWAGEAGVSCDVFTGRYGTARRWVELQRSLTKWLRTLEKPTGLMAANDVRARHVLEACRALELRVPEDVAVIGVDNDEMMCDLTDPPLSSVEQGAWRVGHQAAALLDGWMNGKNPDKWQFVVKPEGVMARRSTDFWTIDDPDVAEAVRFLRERACRHIQICDVAKHVGVSPSTLKNRFRAALGRTIHAELQRLRLDRAKQLLADTDLPLKQVATQTGFRYIQYLTRVFRQHVGQTPGEYRKQRVRGPRPGNR
jgi:LacI family transcriptional regulator